MLDLSFRFDRWFEKLTPSPTEAGTVEVCVVRTGRGVRATPDEVELEAGSGVVGDHWGSNDHDEERNEVSLINVHVIRSLAKGDEVRTPLSGDNFQVDLDLSEENLPVGTTLELGEAELRVSDMPHRPCLQFVKRFGPVAAKRVARANRLGRRGRGVLCEVVRGGRVRRGALIRVVR
jgi:MOSC domain-containing protein YiiM